MWPNWPNVPSFNSNDCIFPPYYFAGTYAYSWHPFSAALLPSLRIFWRKSCGQRALDSWLHVSSLSSPAISAGTLRSCLHNEVPSNDWFVIILNIDNEMNRETFFLNSPHFSRSVAGSYDNEGIAIFALMFTYYLWIKGTHYSNGRFTLCIIARLFLFCSHWRRNCIALSILKFLYHSSHSIALYLSLSPSRENGWIEVGYFDRVVVFLHGVCVGRLRLHHQSHSSARLRPHSHGKVFYETLRRLLRFLHFG